MSEAFHRNQVYDRSSERCLRITKKLAIFVGSTNSPNSIVENAEFRQCVATLDARFPMPSRTLLRKELDKVFFDMKANMQTYLAAAREVTICGRREE